MEEIKRIRIAIIDDGVNKAHFKNIHNLKCFKVRNQKMVEYIPKSTLLTHGTICAAIIQKYVNCQIEIISYKVKDYGKAGYSEDLRIALECCAKDDIDILNVSIGSMEKKDRRSYQAIVNDIVKKGTMVVAAMSNDGHIAYPAMCENVIKVRHNERMLHKVVLADPDHLLYEASSIHKLIMKEGFFTTLPCNSYATPYVSAYLANLLSESGKKD